MIAPDIQANTAVLKLFYRLTILERGLPATADTDRQFLFRIIHNLSSAVVDEGLDPEELSERYEAMCQTDFNSCSIKADLLALRHLLSNKIPAPSLS
jgi:hypothetical protein